MSQYLTREIWPTPIDWGRALKETIDYTFRGYSLGQAAPRGEPLQTHTTRVWDLDLLLSSEQEIIDFDTFTGLLRGRLNGFWIASPESLGDIATVTSADIFSLAHVNLADSWADDACIHLVFEPTSGAAQYGKILSVTDELDGTETVTLEALGGRTLAAGMRVRRLLYCRLADDTESAEFISSEIQKRSVRVVELPTEYAQVETGERPVWLYELEQVIDGTSYFWRFTSLNETINSTLGSGGAKTFTSFPVSHRGLRRTMLSDDEGVTLETWHDAAIMPLSAMVPFVQVRPFTLRIYRTTYDAPNTVTNEFTGRIEGITANGRRLSAKATSLIDAIGRRSPATLIQPGCNWHLYSAPCGVSKASYEATGTITAVIGNLVTISVANPPISGKSTSGDPDWYATGWARVGSALTLQERGIQGNSKAFVKSSVWYMELTLTGQFTGNVVGQTIKIYAGCDGAKSTCKTKFSNFARHGGFVVPQTNPAVRAMEAEVANGNKK